MKTNQYVYPVRLPGGDHFLLSVAGMLKIADAIEAEDPALAKQLRWHAQARKEVAMGRLEAKGLLGIGGGDGEH